MAKRLIIDVTVYLLITGAAGGQPQYEVVFLDPGSWAYGASGGQQVGTANGHAALWSGTAESYIDLNPAGIDASEAWGVSGSQQVGWGQGIETGYRDHALLWSGTAGVYADLNPVGFSESWACGVSGSEQVGYGWGPITEWYYHAFLWSGTADSCVDLNPVGFIDSWAYGISGDQQAGWGMPSGGGVGHALLWSGTAESCVDLHPLSGFTDSVAFGVSDGQQVGCGWGTATGGSEHALLWSGTAQSCVDLNPAGLGQSEARGVCGGLQVGWGYTPDGRYHALLWSGTPESCIDLNTYLPAGYSNSKAYGIDSSGNIVGSATSASGGGWRVVLWVPDVSSTPEQSLTDLTEEVVAGSSQPGINTSLLRKLAAALSNLYRPDLGPLNYKAAINALNAFINEVEAQAGKEIPQEEADFWIGLAQNIIDELRDE